MGSWISAKTRKPEPYVNVIAWDSENQEWVHAQWDGREWSHAYYGQELSWSIKVSHWMPGPEAPKKRAR